MSAAKRGPGRPRLSPPEGDSRAARRARGLCRVELQLLARTLERLDAIAAEHACSRSAAVTWLIAMWASDPTSGI